MSRKQKQPYIPFYVGDYLTDTRILPLNVRGAWVDLILYMWNNNPKGEITGTYEEFARLLGCGVEEIKICILLLYEKKICDCEFLANNSIKIISRKIKNIVETSENRQNSGKMGGNPKLKQKTLYDEGLDNHTLKQVVNIQDKQNPEYENEYESKDESKNTKGGVGENFIQDTFEQFWKIYDKNIARLNCEKLWIGLNPEEITDILNYAPKYVLANPDKQFRVHPQKFLEDQMWHNEIIPNLNGNHKKNGNSKKATGEQLDTALRKRLNG